MNVSKSVDMKKSVDAIAITIQSAYRVRIAKKTKESRVKLVKAIVILQRRHRLRNLRYYHAACKLQCLSKIRKAKKRLYILRAERHAAVVIQCAYRCHLARLVDMNMHSVNKIVVLHSTESVPLHGPEKCFEPKDYTFWIANNNEAAELRIGLSD